MGWLSRLFGRDQSAQRPLALDEGEPQRPVPQPAPPVVRLAEKGGEGRYAHDAVGEFYRLPALNSVWSRLGGDEKDNAHGEAELRLDPTNEHDPNAVAIYVLGSHVAFLDREEAAKFTQQANELASGARFVCRVRIHAWVNQEGETSFDVVVYFAFPLRRAAG